MRSGGGARRFVGRSTELLLADSEIEAAIIGRPSAVVISGEPGIGKTRLAEAIADQASARGIVAAWGRCWEFGGAPAYWPWAEAFRSWSALPSWPKLEPDLALLARIDPDLFGGAGESPPTGDPDRERARLFRAVTELIRRLSSHAPIAFVLDDAHAADTSSLLLLQAVLRSGGLPFFAVVTHREEIAALAGSGRRIRLSGLGEHDVGQFVNDALGHPGSHRLVGELRAATGGNPLYLSEVLAMIAASGKEEIAPTEGVRTAVRAQLAHFSPETRFVLAAAAVIGRPVSLSLLAELSQWPADRVLAAIEPAIRERVLGGDPLAYRFTHGLFRECLYEELGAADRIELHARAADILEASADPSELARHLQRALPIASKERAFAHTVTAGDRAMRAFAYEDAIDHYERALEIGVDPCRALLALGEAKIAVGNRPEAKRDFLRAAEIASDRGAVSELARAAIGHARCAEFVSLDRSVISLLERALRGVEDRALFVRVAGQLSIALWMDPSARDRRVELSGRALEIAREIADPVLLAFALNARLQALNSPDHVEERLAISEEIVSLAKEAGDLERLADGMRWRLSALLEMGDMARASAEIDAYAKLAAELRLPHVAMNAVMRRGMRALMSGRYSDAERLIDEMYEIAVRARDASGELVRTCMRAIVYLDTGRTRELTELTPIFRREADNYAFGAFIRAQLARTLAICGETKEARSELDRMVAADFSLLPRDFVFIASVVLIGETAIALQDRAVIARILQLLAPFCERNVMGSAALPLGSAWRYLGRLSQALGRREDAVTAFERAIVRNQQMGAWPQLAYTEHELGSLLVESTRGEERERGRALIGSAARRARELGMSAIARSDAAEPEAIAELMKSGSTWTIRFEGRAHALKHLRGLEYLARLLASPEEEIHAVDLASPEAAEKAGAKDRGLETIDAKARAAYRKRIAELRVEAEDAEARGDSAERERAEDELEQIAEELERALGLGGKARKTGSATERARAAVTLAIRRAIAAIGALDADLGKHLDVSVRTGTFCSYTPDVRARVRWRVTT
jgi:tetratricopeptide (TPR) repeat protein